MCLEWTGANTSLQVDARPRQGGDLHSATGPCSRDAGQAEAQLRRDERGWDEAETEMKRLRMHYDQLEAENQANPHPVRVVLRYDSGFASRENIAWIIEMGYGLYTNWQQVGGNATMTA